MSHLRSRKIRFLYKTVIRTKDRGLRGGSRISSQGGVYLKKLRRAEGGVKFFGVFCVKKITILCQKIIFFPILGGVCAGCAPLDPPLGLLTTEGVMVVIVWQLDFHLFLTCNTYIQCNITFIVYLEHAMFFIIFWGVVYHKLVSVSRQHIFEVEQIIFSDIGEMDRT